MNSGEYKGSDGNSGTCWCLLSSMGIFTPSCDLRQASLYFWYEFDAENCNPGSRSDRVKERKEKKDIQGGRDIPSSVTSQEDEKVA